LSKGERDRKLKEHKQIVQAFMETYEQFNFLFKENLLFLLFDPEGILINKRTDKYNFEKEYLSWAELGGDFKEESGGTNAVSLALETGNQVYLEPRENYCSFLQDWHSFVSSVRIKEKLLGFIGAYRLEKGLVEKDINRELMRNVILLREKVEKNYIKYNSDLTQVDLTEKQRKILKSLSKGLTEKKIASNLYCSNSTIKYHKKEIFKELDVNSTIEAVVKAIKLKIINLENINLEK